MLIVYIGRKPSKADNVAGTGLVWAPGQSHEVADPLACAKLLKHSDVWSQVAANPPARGLGLPLLDQEDADLAAAAEALAETSKQSAAEEEEREHKAYLAKELADLRAALDEKGIKYHHKAGAEKLRALLQGAAQ